MFVLETKLLIKSTITETIKDKVKFKKIVKKISLLLFVAIYSLFLLELFLLLAPGVLSFIRDPRIFFEKNKERRIYAIGDSFTYGLGIERNETYPKLLENKLKDAPSENLRDVAVINMGKPAHSLSSFYYEIKKIQENNQDQNSIFILQGGWNCNDNDFIRFQKEQSKNPLTQFKLFLNQLRFFRIIKSYYLYKKIYYPHGSEDYVPPVMAMGHYNFDQYQKIAYQYLVAIAEYAQKNKLKVIFLNYPQNTVPENTKTDTEFYHYVFGHKKLTPEDYLIKNDPYQEIAINRVIRSVSQKYQIPLIDINQAFKDADQQNLFLDDHHHPNKDGARVMAEKVYQELLKMEALFN